MVTESLTIVCNNTTCRNEWRIRVMGPHKGTTASGWWIVKCARCNSIFELYIDKHVNTNLLISGGTILRRLDTMNFDEVR